jgi:hypothetical protein
MPGADLGSWRRKLPGGCDTNPPDTGCPVTDGFLWAEPDGSLRKYVFGSGLVTAVSMPYLQWDDRGRLISNATSSTVHGYHGDTHFILNNGFISQIDSAGNEVWSEASGTDEVGVVSLGDFYVLSFPDGSVWVGA